MYLPYQVDWNARGYFTPSLHGGALPAAAHLQEDWRALQRGFAAARAGRWEQLHELVVLARETSSGMMRQEFLGLLVDAGTPRALRAVADDALDSDQLEFPADVAMALAETGMLRHVPDVLELYARRHDEGTFAKVLPRKLSQRLEPEWGDIAEWDRDDDDGELYCAKVEAFLPGLIERIGSPDSTVLYGEIFGVRFLAERFLDVLGDWNRRGEWPRLRQSFEASTGIDLSPGYESRESKPLKLAAILEAFLASPESHRYEHGARYFWGHRIPD